MEIKTLFVDNSGNPFVAFVNYGSRIILSLVLFLVAPTVFAYIAAILYLLILHPIAWKIGDAFREFTQPEAFLSSGAMDTFNKRVFWMMGPQFFSALILAFVIMFSFYFMYSSKVEDEIANTPPMSLSTDQATGYPKFDIRTNKDFGSNAFLSAAMRNPILLTGGVPVDMTIYGMPRFEDTADKNLKKLSFGSVRVIGYAPLQCVDALAQRNQVIHEKVKSLPGRDCTTAGCISIVDPSTINPTEFKNESCKQLAELPGDSVLPRCVISIDGESLTSGDIHRSTNKEGCKTVVSMIFSYTNGNLQRVKDLENLHWEKLKAISSEYSSESSSGN